MTLRSICWPGKPRPGPLGQPRPRGFAELLHGPNRMRAGDRLVRGRGAKLHRDLAAHRGRDPDGSVSARSRSCATGCRRRTGPAADRSMASARGKTVRRPRSWSTVSSMPAPIEATPRSRLAARPGPTGPPVLLTVRQGAAPRRPFRYRIQSSINRRRRSNRSDRA